METTSLCTAIGTVTYEDFPTYDAVSRLRPDVIKGLMVLYRMLGFCSLKQLNLALGNPEDDGRAEWMLSRSGVAQDVDESCSEDNRRDTAEIQKTVLKDDERHYTIRVTDFVNSLERCTYSSNSQTVLRALLKKAQEDQAEQPESANKETEEKPTPPKADDIESQVAKIAKNSPVSPVYDYYEAKQTAGYFKKLTDYFPNVTVDMIIAYLFFGAISRCTIGATLRNLGASKPRGFRPGPESLIERTAFVAWTGGNWRKYYESGGVIETLPPPSTSGQDSQNGRPQKAKPIRRAVAPKPVVPKPVLPPPAPKQPTVKVEGFDPSSARATISITGTVKEIYQILAMINGEPK